MEEHLTRLRYFCTVGILVALPAIVGAAEKRESIRFPLTRVYDRELSREAKRSAIESTIDLFAGLGIELFYDATTLERIERDAGGRLDLEVEESVDALYDAIYYLTDLARLPPATYPLVARIAVVKKLRERPAGGGKHQRVPLAREPRTGFLLVDSENINQLNMFGSHVHPKVNFAMLLQVGIEARLAAIPAAAVEELGLDIVIDDAEWSRLNAPGDAGARFYNGEDIAHVGVGSLLSVSPPGMVYDAVKELKTGIPPDVYAGLPEANHPWWSPRHSPALDRQSNMRCMFSRRPRFFDRLAGTGGMRPDTILKEKTRLLLYAAFVASGGALDHQFWKRRHPRRTIVLELTRDFGPGLLEQLNKRLETSSTPYRIEPATAR